MLDVSTSLSPDATVGEYRLKRRLAVGGMAEVFLADMPQPVGANRTVVVKRMLVDATEDPTAAARFHDEAVMGACVHHPNFVRVLSYGEHEGQPYVALEYVPGSDLWRLQRTLVRERVDVPIELKTHIICEVLQGLSAMHNAHNSEGWPLNIVHRDVSPSNVLLSVHGDVKLSDLGIAVSLSRSRQASESSAPRGNGKLGYMPAEQVEGRELSQRADLFSVGVVAAELLIGERLFERDSELTTLLAIRDGDISRLHALKDRMPPGLYKAVTQALETDPRQRIGSADALLELLQPFRDNDARRVRAQLATLVQLVENTHRSGEHQLKPNGGETARATMPCEEFFDVHDKQGNLVHQTMSYADLIQRIATGKVSSTMLLSLNGGPLTPLRDVPRINRHVPMGEIDPERRTRISVDLKNSQSISFADGAFITALAQTTIDELSGMWVCEFNGVRKQVYLIDGTPRFVASNVQGELLGEYLVRQRVITRTDLDLALAVMPRFDGRLGDTIVGLGLVDSVALFHHITNQVREKLVDLFTWVNGRGSFYADVEPPSDSFSLSMDPWITYDAGMQARVAQGLEDRLILTRGAEFVQRARQLPQTFAVHELPPTYGMVLRETQSPIRVDDLAHHCMQELPSDPQAAYRAVGLLLYAGALHWV